VTAAPVGERANDADGFSYRVTMNDLASAAVPVTIALMSGGDGGDDAAGSTQGGAVQVESSLPIALESAWFQPSNLWSENPVSKFAFYKFNVYCYIKEKVKPTATSAGADSPSRSRRTPRWGGTSWIQLWPIAWKRLVSTLEPMKWKPGFKVCFFKCNLYRYSTGALTLGVASVVTLPAASVDLPFTPVCAELTLVNLSDPWTCSNVTAEDVLAGYPGPIVCRKPEYEVAVSVTSGGGALPSDCVGVDAAGWAIDHVYVGATFDAGGSCPATGRRVYDATSAYGYNRTTSRALTGDSLPGTLRGLSHCGNATLRVWVRSACTVAGRVVTPGCQIGYSWTTTLPVIKWCFDHCKIT
jgi:hypothetical protein